MQLHKLFKVLVVGGAVLTTGITGCIEAPHSEPEPDAVVADSGATDSGSLAVDVQTAADAGVRDQGVSSWMHWFDFPDVLTAADAGAVPPVGDDGPQDAGAPDAVVSGDDAGTDGALSWLSWV